VLGAGRDVKLDKMHGAGNDFLVADGSTAPSLERLLPGLVARLCHRRLGLGADGVLLLLPAGVRRARVVYWNADGTPAAFCANGTRCAARFVAERWGWPESVLETGFAALPASVAGRQVTLQLPAPEAVHEWCDLGVDGESVRARFLVVGVPHLVVPVTWSDFWERPLEPLAPSLRRHEALPPGGANVSFVRRGAESLEVRSFERGVEGETLSCGSGDVAVALVALAEGWSHGRAEVLTASGRTLLIEPQGTPPACPARLTGPAEWVGELEVAPELLAG
jgi:diaminopimelate epimerase